MDPTILVELDGNYFKISNLTILANDRNDVGLFGNVNGAILRNFELIDVFVNLTSMHGYVGLCGYLISAL